MKKYKVIPYIIVIIVITIFVTGCNDPITDFGFDGSISGKIVDQSGNIVSGDITGAGFVVNALGDNDKVEMEMRVKGDGTFANNKLYPKSYTVWVEGPVISNQEYTIDLTGRNTVEQDFVVTPFLTIPSPTLVGNPTTTSIEVSYQITENNGYIAEIKEVYCSTVPYPTKDIGSGPSYDTKTVTLSDLQGTVSITGLSSGTKYFIRIGAKAEGSVVYNFSEQIVVNTL